MDTVMDGPQVTEMGLYASEVCMSVTSIDNFLFIAYDTSLNSESEWFKKFKNKAEFT